MLAGGVAHCAFAPSLSPKSKPRVQSSSGTRGAAARALLLCSDHPAACMHCRYICARVLALASYDMLIGRVYCPRDVTQAPLKPRPEHVVKDGAATSLPTVRTDGAEGA